MNDHDHQLPGLLAQWRELTVREGEAIQAGQWAEVARHQRFKAELQPAISRADQAARSAPHLRAAVTELKALEQRNANWLGERISHAKRVRDEAEQSSRNLRRVRQSYASVTTSNWHSYS